MTFRALVAIVSVFAIVGLSEAISGTQKVIQLLGDMEAKAKKGKNEEEVEFSKFNQFCENKQGSTAREIKVAAELMESLAADIGKLTSDISELGEKIAALHNDVATDTAALKDANAQREKDHASYSDESQ